MERDLKKINNEIKSYINEAKANSNSCRNKLINILGKTFSVDLPLENYANIDIELTEKGNIIMRGDLYETTDEIKTFAELETKYNIFKEKADKLLKQKDINSKNIKDINNIFNIIIVIILSIVYLIIGILIVKSIISLQLFTASILIALLSSYLHPNIKARFEQAKNYLKRRFKK
ncbi:MAG: hypothetical protein PUC82_02780 [bacterium]|nr:hypothetical protein [bacterium]